MKLLLFFALCVLQSCVTHEQFVSNVLQGGYGDIDVIIFSSTDCPIANAMAPEIERLHQYVHNKGGELRMVHVWQSRTYTDANEHAKEYGLTMEIFVDTDHELVQKFNATVTPEAVVLTYDETGNPVVVYQGLINNFFDSPGNRRDQASEHYVRDAVDAILMDETVNPSYRKPTGCVIEQMQ
jgi:thioredoxin-related protein